MKIKSLNCVRNLAPLNRTRHGHYLKPFKHAVVNSIRAGDFTRMEAAAVLGVSPTTIVGWVASPWKIDECVSS